MSSMRRIFLILSLLLPVTVLVSSASLAQTKLDASILSYDGKDFVRTETTLMNEGQAAVGTKLEPDSAAYKALVEKKSYTGPVSFFWSKLPRQLCTAHRCRRQIDRCPVRGGREIVVS
jgi:hypothetical protein